MAKDNPLIVEYEALKKQLLSIGVAIPGSIHALYALCGSQNCECAYNKSKRHGPYYRWHYRSGGRQVTIGLEDKDVIMFETWIRNREEIERIIQRMLDISVSYAKEMMISNLSHKKAPKKNNSSPRRK